MKITVNSYTPYLSFQRRLKDSEKPEYSSVLKQAKNKLGNTGHSVLIVPSASLPDLPEKNPGCGNLLTKDSKDFFDFAKLYWDINYVQLLPEGIYGNHWGKIRPYSGSSLDLGPQVIDLELLATAEFANILDASDIKAVQDANKIPDKNVRINYENVIDKDSATDKALRKAFDKLLEKEDSPETKSLMEDMQDYYIKNKDWLESKSIFQALAKKNNSLSPAGWKDETERELFNTDIVSSEKRLRTISEIVSHKVYGKEKAFYIFKQYLADKHLEIAKKELNNMGLKLSGDMLLNCSQDEVWANPKAFHKNKTTEWGFPAIDFDSKEGKEFLKKKVRNFARRYDGIRIDASWLYTEQILNSSNGRDKKYYYEEILDLIDEEIKNVKGKDFNLDNIMHEFEADPSNYALYEHKYMKKAVIDRLKIFKTDHMAEDWANIDDFRERSWKKDSYVLGATNHDSISLKALYKNKETLETQINALSKILKIPKEKIQSLQDFIKAKFADPMRSKHNMIFFSDALNLEGEYHSETDSHRQKIPSNYQDTYFESLKKGEGFNIMDALEKAFVAEGLDETEPDLYKKIKKYRDILTSDESYEPPAEKKLNNRKGLITAITVVGISLLLVILSITTDKNKKTKATNENKP